GIRAFHVTGVQTCALPILAGCMNPPETWPLPTGLGGVFGDFVLNVPAYFTGSYPKGILGLVIASLLFVPALWLMFFGAGIIGRQIGRASCRETVGVSMLDS